MKKAKKNSWWSIRLMTQFFVRYKTFCLASESFDEIKHRDCTWCVWKRERNLKKSVDLDQSAQQQNNFFYSIFFFVISLNWLNSQLKKRYIRCHVTNKSSWQKAHDFSVVFISIFLSLLIIFLYISWFLFYSSQSMSFDAAITGITLFTSMNEMDTIMLVVYIRVIF